MTAGEKLGWRKEYTPYGIFSIEKYPALQRVPRIEVTSPVTRKRCKLATKEQFKEDE